MRASIDRRIQNDLQAEYVEGETSLIRETINQLTEYFDKNRTGFEIPLIFTGSDFQKEVWNELLKIPYGKTNTYLKLSRQLGNEKSVRAVATANGANAISIIVPCHRVIAGNGNLTGYAGGLPAKKSLLKLEGASIISGQLDLFSD